MGNSAHGDKCTVIGPGMKKCSNIISPPGDREVCVQTQECNSSDGCTVSCFDHLNLEATNSFCTGCRNGKVKMEGQDMNGKHFNITCEQNGEEMPGHLICDRPPHYMCGCPTTGLGGSDPSVEFRAKLFTQQLKNMFVSENIAGEFFAQLQKF